MLRRRVIPCLLLKDGGLVKTRKFSNPMYVGDPINAIRIFNEKEVDELVVLDIEASKIRKEPDYALIEQYASECFMPLCYGGGVRTIDQARCLFSIGVEKICIQTGALGSISLIRSLAEQFGSQSVVVSIDIKNDWLGRQRMYASSMAKYHSSNWQEYLEQIECAGAGEIFLNAVDRDGEMNGMDLGLIRDVVCKVKIPVIVAGGVGSLSDISSAFKVGASAVAAGAFFVYHGTHRAVLITYPTHGEIDALIEDTHD